VAEAVLVGWTSDATRADDLLRRRLLQGTGALCGTLLDLAAGQVGRRNATRALAAGRRARARFARTARKALAKAASAGVVYSGPGAEEIAAAMDTLARDVGNASAGVTP
jgi:hypothetical protein